MAESEEASLEDELLLLAAVVGPDRAVGEGEAEGECTGVALRE